MRVMAQNGNIGQSMLISKTEAANLIENGELFREEPGGTYTPIGRVAAKARKTGHER
jgi:hypothetical protein